MSFRHGYEALRQGQVYLTLVAPCAAKAQNKWLDGCMKVERYREFSSPQRASGALSSRPLHRMLPPSWTISLTLPNPLASPAHPLHPCHNYVTPLPCSHKLNTSLHRARAAWGRGLSTSTLRVALESHSPQHPRTKDFIIITATANVIITTNQALLWSKKNE